MRGLYRSKGDGGYGIRPVAPIAYTILVRCLIAEQLHHSQGKHSKLQDLLGNDTKGLVSIALYITGGALAYVNPRIAYVLFAAVAVIWLIPDRRISRKLAE